jgi:hypothetical protein
VDAAPATIRTAESERTRVVWDALCSRSVSPHLATPPRSGGDKRSGRIAEGHKSLPGALRRGERALDRSTRIVKNFKVARQLPKNL